MMAQEDLISVVIPIYNVEKYLKQCVESVLSQTYKNLEVILVDDGSEDASGEIADRYQKQDERIRVIHKENGGLSDARNVGMTHATGQYLFFLDSDDLIADDAIESLWAICQKMHTEIAVSGMVRFTDEIKTETHKTCENSISCFDTVEAMRRMLKHEGFGHEAPGKLFFKELWKGIDFPVGMLYEDYATTYKVMLRASKIGHQERPIYYYRVREGSIMHSTIKEKNLMLLDISDSVTNEIVSEIPELEIEAISLQVVTYMKLMEGILKIDINAYPNVQKRILKKVKQESRILLYSLKVRIIDKIKIIALFENRRLFVTAYKLGEYVNRIRIRWDNNYLK